MTYWSTRGSDKKKDFVIIKHYLPNIDYMVQGIKFRGGYAVVEKNSKAYYLLKKMPLLKNAHERPLVELRELPFITRTSDVKMVYGQEVYKAYLDVLNPIITEEKKEQVEEIEEKHIEVKGKCAYRKTDGNLCGRDALDYSPSGYCNLHVLKDEEIEKYIDTTPAKSRMTKKEKKEHNRKLLKSLARAKKEGKF